MSTEIPALAAGALPQPSTFGTSRAEKKVILASSLGTAFEWYDFNLFAALAPIIARHFFTNLDPSTALIFALLAFSAGFVVRPFGALVFGRVGDVIGRKHTFLVTILIMGLSTFALGLMPGYGTIGIAAPIILIGFRLLQGLAVGGEYGGAVVYVAEHAPARRRGEFTSWIQTTGTLGFLASLVATFGARTLMGETAFIAWGWRLPFLFSIVLLALSVWIRLSMHESPVFLKMKAEGGTSKAPLREAFTEWGNLRIVLLALFGMIAGFAVVWYAAQFYVLLFLMQTLKVEAATANLLVIVSLTIATPFFVVFGALSDRVGRKKIILTGILLSGLCYFPMFRGLTHFANPALEKALASAPVVVSADPNDCQFQFDATGTRKFTSSCDIAKAKLVATSVNYTNEAAPRGAIATVRIGDKVLPSFDGKGLSKVEFAQKESAFSRALTTAIAAAGYPLKADPAHVNKTMLVVLIVILVLFLTMAYGPSAAMLVEMFPTRIRYSSLSLPYHVGTGWFGGLMPTTAFAMVAWRGDIYFGLWYPVIIALLSAVIGILFVRETKDVDIKA